MDGFSMWAHDHNHLRHTSSTQQLRPTASQRPVTQYQTCSLWDGIPIEYQPVARRDARVVSGYYSTSHVLANLPGPPPRPRTVSPRPMPQALYRPVTPTLSHPNPKLYRRRSALDLRNPWRGRVRCETTVDTAKSTRVEIATALPPEHLDPPPPYSVYPPPSDFARQLRLSNRHASMIHPSHQYVPYNPASFQAVNTTAIPTIGRPQPPTPISPINNLDTEYLALRRARQSEQRQSMRVDHHITGSR